MYDVFKPVPTVWPKPFDTSVRCDKGGFTLGDDTLLIRCRDDGRPAIEDDSARCLALLSVICRRPIGPEVLDPIQAAAAYWAAGDKALANLRLVFSGLPKVGSPADAARLQAAAFCLDRGLAPRDLMKALDLDASVLDVVKFDPNEPRVPAGSGEESGRWTDDARSEDFVSSSEPRRIQIAANGPFKPEGIETVPSQSVDPLDPANLNKVPPSPQEQQAIVNTLNIIAGGSPGEIQRLHPHPYKNLPAIETGAVLPADPQGYIAYDVKIGDNPDGKDRGKLRIVSNLSKDKAYYTSNHYLSFYGVDIAR